MKKLLTICLMFSILAFVGCGKKKDLKPEDTGLGSGAVSESEMPKAEDIESSRADSDSERAMGLQTIHFPYDSFDISGENREILNGNIAILKANPTIAVQVEGHCDERGGIQYNLALGEKRANAIMQQMVASGIGKSRLTILSLGKEKPIVPGSNEEAWAKNRRGNYVITAK